MTSLSPSPVVFYRFERFVRVGLVQIKHPSYGTQHWRRGVRRGDTCSCARCDRSILAKDETWRPMTHAGNRKDRLCSGCMTALSNGLSA